MTFSKLGTDTDTQQPVYLPKSARFQGFYIIGMQRMGKSGLIENLIMEDIKQQIGVCVLDPHYEGGIIDNIIARLDPKHEKDVILLDINDFEHPFGLNVFACSDLGNPVIFQRTLDQVRHIFEKILGVSTETRLILQYLRNCTHTLVLNPGYTMADIPLLLEDEQCRKKLVAKVTDSDVLRFWSRYEHMKPSEQEERSEPLLRRLQDFLQVLTRPIVGQSNSTIDFIKIMDDRKILLVKLHRRLEEVTTLIGSIIVALFYNASASRKTQRQFHLYADEFQNFATEDFAVLLEQAGKSAIGVTMAHQNRSQLELSNKQADKQLKDRTLNVGSLVVFRVPIDADDLAGQFDTTPPPPTPEEKTRRAIQTPVMEPIQFMLHKGVHPHPEVRNFINVYGQEIVQGVKNEEEAARNYQHSLNTYYRDVHRGYGLMTSEPSPPTQYFHLILESLNQLLYQAMIVGKQGGNTDTIPIVPELIDYFIKAVTTVPYEVKQYHMLQKQYIDYAVQQQIHVGDWNSREWEVQNRLTQLALPSPRQREVRVAEARYTKAVENLRSALRRAFAAQVQEILKRCVIVRRGSWYYRPNFRHDYTFDEGRFEFWEGRYDISVYHLSNDSDFQHHLNELRYYAGSQEFRSFDEAIAYHVQALRFLWFRVEPTLRDKNWWQHKQRVVECTDHDKKWNKSWKPKLYDPTLPETLDMWVPKPGIDRTWYTDAMLESVVESALQTAIDPKREKRWSLYTYARSAASVGGEDYGQLTEWDSPITDELYKEAAGEVYDAIQGLTKLQEEIASQIYMETLSLKSELGILTELLKLKPLYDKFVADLTNQLRMVMRVLGVERIETESGQQEIVMGHGIQLSSAEMEARISNQLLHLQKFTAWVKIAENIPQNPGKKCVSCRLLNRYGAKDCQSCGTQLPAPNEYVIETISPGQGIGKIALEQRKATIQVNNIHDKFLKRREDVEKELAQRQAGCSGSAPAQPHARQVPVQGNCPNCGFSNNPGGSKFCNKCGAKLN